MLYKSYNFWGVNVIWWFIWVILLFWFLAALHEDPYQIKKKNSVLDIL